jgi:hypothetical protein
MTLEIQRGLLEIVEQRSRRDFRRQYEERFPNDPLPPGCDDSETRPLNLPWPLIPEDLED